MFTIRHCLLPAAVLALSGIAYGAQGALPADAPNTCVQLVHQTPIEGGLISAGNCLAEARMNKVHVQSSAESADALAAATAPSIAMFDRVIAQGNPYWSMIAEDAKRDTYRSMAVRLRNSVPDQSAEGQRQVDPLVANWNDGAAQSTARIAQLASAHPDIANRDEVIAGVASRAQADEARQVAIRGQNRAGNPR